MAGALSSTQSGGSCPGRPTLVGPKDEEESCVGLVDPVLHSVDQGVCIALGEVGMSGRCWRVVELVRASNTVEQHKSDKLCKLHWCTGSKNERFQGSTFVCVSAHAMVSVVCLTNNMIHRTFGAKT